MHVVLLVLLTAEEEKPNARVDLDVFSTLIQKGNANKPVHAGY